MTTNPPTDIPGHGHEITQMTRNFTTVTLSPALKAELVRIRDAEDYGSLNETILGILHTPGRGSRHIAGDDAQLTTPIKVDEFTRHTLQRIRDKHGFPDYEAVIRARAGIAPRDTGERPVPLKPLD